MAIRIVVQGWGDTTYEGTVHGTQIAYAHGPVGHGAPVTIVYEDHGEAKEAKKLREKLEKAGYRRIVTALDGGQGLIPDVGDVFDDDSKRSHPLPQL